MGGCFRRLCLRAEHSQDNDVPDFQLLDRSRTLSFRAVKVVFRKLCQKSSNPESDFRLVIEVSVSIVIARSRTNFELTRERMRNGHVESI